MLAAAIAAAIAFHFLGLDYRFLHLYSSIHNSLALLAGVPDFFFRFPRGHLKPGIIL